MVDNRDRAYGGTSRPGMIRPSIVSGNTNVGADAPASPGDNVRDTRLGAAGALLDCIVVLAAVAAAAAKLGGSRATQIPEPRARSGQPRYGGTVTYSGQDHCVVPTTRPVRHLRDLVVSAIYTRSRQPPRTPTSTRVPRAAVTGNADSTSGRRLAPRHQVPRRRTARRGAVKLNMTPGSEASAQLRLQEHGHHHGHGTRHARQDRDPVRSTSPRTWTASAWNRSPAQLNAHGAWPPTSLEPVRSS
jgi:hypothetical protein